MPCTPATCRTIILRAAAIAQLVALAACADDRPEAVVPTCAEQPLSQVELGSPSRGTEGAEFETTGAPMFVTARRFEHGGPFDPAVGRTAIWVGPSSHPPTLNEHTGEVGGTTLQTTVTEGTYSRLDLPAGRYWLWSSTGGDIVLIGCSSNALTLVRGRF